MKEKIKKLKQVFKSMKGRCYYGRNTHYFKYYGEKGIVICDLWMNNIQEFINWSLNNGYEEGLVIDRIDGNKNYSPDNCRWITQKENMRNTSRNIFIEYDNQKICLSEFCEKYNLSYDAMVKYNQRYGKEKLLIRIEKEIKGIKHYMERRNSIFITINDKQETLVSVCRQFNLNYASLKKYYYKYGKDKLENKIKERVNI